MKSPEFVAHGTSSEKDAKGIESEGFFAKEGRATVSGNLIYSFEWASAPERRKGSQSESAVEETDRGRIVVMKVPENFSVDYATHTDIEIDDVNKEISGYTSKYESGRRQLAFYNEGDVLEKQDSIENAKEESKAVDVRFSEFLGLYGIDSSIIKSKSDVVEAIRDFDDEHKLEVLAYVEEYEKQKIEFKKAAEPEVSVPKEAIVMSIVPTAELGKVIGELSEKIRALEMVDIPVYAEEIAKLIETSNENTVTSGADVRELLTELLATTVESEVVNMIRNLSLEVKRVQEFTIYNRDRAGVKDKVVDKRALKQKLESIQQKIESDNFDLGSEKLNRYLKVSVAKLTRELEK